jgi:hypothetical protein
MDNLKQVAEYIRGADTEELLDRVTVYRQGMEPAALDLMEGELDRRGVTRDQIAAHDAKRRESAIILSDGTAMRCSFCDRPAVLQARGWHWMKLRIPFVALLIGRGDAPLGFSIPIFPMRFAYCEFHAAAKQDEGTKDANAEPNQSQEP